MNVLIENVLDEKRMEHIFRLYYLNGPGSLAPELLLFLLGPGKQALTPLRQTMHDDDDDDDDDDDSVTVSLAIVDAASIDG
jgi:hypothetical protein